MTSNTKKWDRLGALLPESLSGEPKKLYDDIVTYFQTPYIYKLPDGKLIGPFGIELHTPGAGYAWLGFTKSLADIHELSPLAREIAILVTGYHEQAAYQVYAHSAVSALPKEDLETLKAGTCPEHLDQDCQMAFKIATELNNIPGPLAEATWKEGLDVLGLEATTAVIHYVGFYKYVSTILNGFDAQVPTDP